MTACTVARASRSAWLRTALACAWGLLAWACASTIPDELACPESAPEALPAPEIIQSCLARPDAVAALDRLQRDVVTRWSPKAGPHDSGSATVRFRLTSEGTVSEACVLQATSRREAEQTAALLRSYRPEQPYPSEATCLAGLPLSGRFEVHTKGSRGGNGKD